MLHTHIRAVPKTAGSPGSERSQLIAAVILSDCNRPDWDTADLADALEAVYNSEGPAVAAEIWNVLKGLVAQHCRAVTPSVA